MTRAAAECIAENEVGLAPGIAEWIIDPVYNYGFETVVWAVANTTEQGPGMQSGDGVTLHATTGEVLSEWGWDEIECEG